MAEADTSAVAAQIDNEMIDTEPQQTNGSSDSVKESVEKKRTGRFKNHSSIGIRSKYDNLPESNDAEEIRRQVEFYFSEANLPRDEYLFLQVGGSKNIPFPLKQLHTFSRMKHFQPYSAVVDAVKESKELDLNEKEEVSRKVPLGKEYTEDLNKNRRIYEEKSLSRTIVAKGFGAEEATTQTQVEEYFAPYGDLVSVRLRREQDGNFKGSAFVEFADEATATKFLDLADKPKWKDTLDLEFSDRKAWEAEKREKFGDRRPHDSNPKRGGDHKRDANKGRGRGGRGGGRGGRGGRGGNRGRRGDNHGDRYRPNKRSRDGDDGGDGGEEQAKKPRVESESTKSVSAEA